MLTKDESVLVHEDPSGVAARNNTPSPGRTRFCTGDVCECSNSWVGVGIHVLEHLLSLNAPITGAAFYTTRPTRRSDAHLNIFLTFALPLRTAGYAMVSAARPDLQLVSLSHVSGLSSLRSAAEVAVISLLASAP